MLLLAYIAVQECCWYMELDDQLVLSLVGFVVLSCSCGHAEELPLIYSASYCFHGHGMIFSHLR